MPSIEVQIRLVPDPGEYDVSHPPQVTQFHCSEFGPGPWNSVSCSFLMMALQDFLWNHVRDFSNYLPRARPIPDPSLRINQQTMAEVQLAFETMIRNGITVDQAAVGRLRYSIVSDVHVHKKPDQPPPTRFERDDVI